MSVAAKPDIGVGPMALAVGNPKTTTASGPMKCTVSASALADALGTAGRAISQRSTLPVLSNVLLTTDGDVLVVTGTNLDLTISVRVDAEIAGEGSITVPARLLTEYTKSQDDAPCRLDVDEKTQTLKVACGVHRTVLHGLAAAEFPLLRQSDGGSVLALPASAFGAAVRQTSIAASHDEASPVLTGILLEAAKDTLTLVATDRHRLALRALTVEGAEREFGAATAIVSSRHMQEAARAIGSETGSVKIAVSEKRNHVTFDVGDVQICSRLIEGTYPTYRQVIPVESKTTVRLATDQLLREVKTASVLARDAANPVRLIVSPDCITLRAQTAEVGDDEAPLTAGVEGDDVEIAFNARYLLDALGVLGGEQVELALNGSLQPGVIRQVDDDSLLFLLMPVRIP